MEIELAAFARLTASADGARRMSIIPDVRRCGRVIVEALALWAREEVSAEEGQDRARLIREILRSATDGLEYREYPREHALSAVRKRFRYQVTGGNGSGSVRSGVKRREARKQERTVKLMQF